MLPNALRWLLLGAILILPGGILLAPVLAADALRRRARRAQTPA